MIVPVFKTGDRHPCDGDGEFDSHSLPPLFSTFCSYYRAYLGEKGDRTFKDGVINPYLRQATSLISGKPQIEVICEASDGLEALRKAEELQPDLVLLDIGLPKMNGIETCRKLRKLAPESKIIFVTQESSADVVKAALSAGAKGYVLMTFAPRGLIAAVDAVLLDEQFGGQEVWGTLG